MKEAIRQCARKSLGLFARVVTGNWDSRFAEVEVTALMEMNAFVHRMRNLHPWIQEGEGGEGIFDLDKREDVREKLPKSLLKNLPCELRVSLGWDTDMTDIDLHVYEPSGEEASYENQKTRIGGRMSRDFTQGYGPEEYVIKSALGGKYVVKAKYYSSHREDFSGATTLLLRFTTNFGHHLHERTKVVALRLSENKEMVEVGSIDIPKKPWQD
mmetsp:Transcript_3348/g.5179  ORF Transcript_3348/g.5179 Transcript_3348/m.5179 type:complete len:213 (+) Transcript_3348:65-703(+)